MKDSHTTLETNQRSQKETNVKEKNIQNTSFLRNTINKIGEKIVRSSVSFNSSCSQPIRILDISEIFPFSTYDTIKCLCQLNTYKENNINYSIEDAKKYNYLYFIARHVGLVFVFPFLEFGNKHKYMIFNLHIGYSNSGRAHARKKVFSIFDRDEQSMNVFTAAVSMKRQLTEFTGSILKDIYWNIITGFRSYSTLTHTKYNIDEHTRVASATIEYKYKSLFLGVGISNYFFSYDIEFLLNFSNDFILFHNVGSKFINVTYNFDIIRTCVFAYNMSKALYQSKIKKLINKV